jgi:hypothetical protein
VPWSLFDAKLIGVYAFCMQHDDEEWRDVVEFPDHYEVSSLGRVRSKVREATSPTATRRRYGGQILKPNLTTFGYLQVPLSIDRTRYMRRIHTLVLESFVGPSNGLVCNHKDAVRTNNRLDNLEWCTQYQNVRHSIDVLGHKFGRRRSIADADAAAALKLRSEGWTITAIADHFGTTFRVIQKATAGSGYENMPKGEANPSARLTDNLVREIRSLYACGMSSARIAKQLGFGNSTVKKVIKRETWRHVE